MLIIFGLLAVAVIGLAGYAGVATSAPPTPTPAPDTVAVTRCDAEQSVAAPGVLVNVDQMNVVMPIDGRLSDITVQVGGQVEEGQVLARLDTDTKNEALIAIKTAEEELEDAQDERSKLVLAQGSKAQIAEYEGRVYRTEKQLREAENEYDAVAGLPDNDPAKERARAAVNRIKAKLAQYQSKLTWAKGNATEEDIEIADARVALAQSRLDTARAIAASGEIVSPIDGIILSLEVNSGEATKKDETLFVIADPKALEVKANITEEDYPLVAIGQVAELFFDARPDVTIRGKIERIIPKRIEGDRPLYNIYISLDEVPDGLADGMTSDTAITIAKHEDVLCLPRATVRASSGDTTTVKVWNGFEEMSKEIALGLRGDTYVEIVSGLEEGEQVVTR
jgi:RND family efflux transporter MFP subunit